jgi:hypothetical protein
VGLRQGGGDGLDRAVGALAPDTVPQQRRHVAPGRAGDEDGLPGQAAKAIPADAVHNDRVRQGRGSALGHDLLQRPPSLAGRVDYVPIPFSHEGPPQGAF